MRDWKNLVRERIAALGLEPTAEADLIEEIAQHLEARYRELESGGAAEEEAYRQAIAELDDIYPLGKGRKRSGIDAVSAGDARRGNVFEDLWRDLRYAARTMHKSPLFVVFVVLTLALGIGANTTVFTLINTLILNPLPVPDLGELQAVSAEKTGNTSKGGTPLFLSYPDWKDYRNGNGVFRELAGYTSPRVITWRAGAASERMFAELVTGNYFSALGLHPAKGRFFLPEEDSSPGGHPVAVLNFGTWQSRFGGAADIVGRTLRLNNIDFTVIGVAPPQFIGINAIFGPDFWLPASMGEMLFPGEMKNLFDDRSKMLFLGIGRLKPGKTPAEAQANLTALAADLAGEYPATDEGRTAAVQSVRNILFADSFGGSAPVLFASAGLLIVVGIVLLIACSNVANLLLARSAARQQEMAVRMAMGASRRRLVRQLLTESVLLGLLSGALGLLFGYASLRLLFGALPGSSNFAAPKFDGTVFLFSLLVSLATGFLFGIIPAWKASGGVLAETLKEETRTLGRSRNRITLANALLAGQVAFSFLLLLTATLFLRGIGRAYHIDPGFQPAHLAIVMTSPGQAGYSRAQTEAFYKDARERVAAIPGIEAVSWSSNIPLWARAQNGLEIEGRRQRRRADTLTTVVNIVDTGYFAASGVILEDGRDFTENDRETSTPVAIVNEKIARDFWSSDSALGKRLKLPGEKRMCQIVGVARNANYTTWGEAPQFCVYVPLKQHDSDAMTLYARTRGDPKQFLRPIQRALNTVAPEVLGSDARTGSDIVDGGLFQAKMGVALLSVFGLLALGLANIGLYGILAYSVNQRRREIGLRMALGAGRRSVLWLVLKQGMALVLAGLLIGFAASLLTGRLLGRMLYGLSGNDPASVAGAAAILLAIALLACYLPARGASRVDPLVALREG